MNDVALTQTSAVQSLRATGLRGKELWRGAMEVRRDHVAGALPLLLRTDGHTPWWVVLSGEGMFSELVALLCMILVIPLIIAPACWYP